MWESVAQVVRSKFHCIRVWFLLLWSAMGKAVKKKKSKAERDKQWKHVEWTDSEEDEPYRDASNCATEWSKWEAGASDWEPFTAACGAWT